MSWADCGTDSKGRPIGYAFAATCDHPGCTEEIDRGLAYACGGMHGTFNSCEGYFCEKHLFSVDDPFDWLNSGCLCEKCKHEHNELLIEELMRERS